MTSKKTIYETVSVDLPETSDIAGFTVHKHQLTKELNGGLDRLTVYTRISEQRDVEIHFRYPVDAYSAFESLAKLTKKIDYQDMGEDGCTLKLYNVLYKDVLNALRKHGVLDKKFHGRASEYLQEAPAR